MANHRLPPTVANLDNPGLGLLESPTIPKTLVYPNFASLTFQFFHFRLRRSLREPFEAAARLLSRALDPVTCTQPCCESNFCAYPPLRTSNAFAARPFRSIAPCEF